MTAIHSVIKPLVAVAAAVLLAACAQSPQKITLAPSFPAPEQAIGNKQPVHVRVSDDRRDKVLGSGGGAYRDTALITLGESLSLAIQPALKDHLKALGFEVDSLSPQTTDLHVVFESLVYNHPDTDGVGHPMDMEAQVRVEAVRQNSRYEGRYKIKRQEKFFNAPSEPHNEEMVNKLVVDVLESMLADAKLQNFLLDKSND